MNEVKNACIRAIEGWFIVESNSGFRMLFSDPEAYHAFIPAGSGPDEIGKELKLALDASRKLSIEEAQEFKESATKWKNWVIKMVEVTGCKNEKSLFQKMALCNVKESDNTIIISPTIKKRGSAWEGRGEKYKVSIDRAEGNLAISNAIMQALESCMPGVCA